MFVYKWQIDALKDLVPNTYITMSHIVREYIELIPLEKKLPHCIPNNQCKLMSLSLSKSLCKKLEDLATFNEISQSECLRGIIHNFQGGILPTVYVPKTHNNKLYLSDNKQLKNIQHPEMGYHKRAKYVGKNKLSMEALSHGVKIYE